MSTKLTNGSESYYGTSGTDTVYALDGDDTVYGFGDTDYLHGDRGADELYGHPGDDYLFGDAGNDTIYGNPGFDTIEGDAGNDDIYGGTEDDQIEPGSGNDTIVAGAGDDDELSYKYSDAAVTIDLGTGLASGGYAENDVFDADPQGNPVEAPENVRGSFHADVLAGDGRDNDLYGLYGDDLLNGEGGDDVIHPFKGSDTVIGGQGEDTVSYEGAVGGVTASLATGGSGGYAAGDTYNEDLLGNDIDAPENLTGSTNDDTLAGDGESNEIRGLGGDDVLKGGAHGDALHGGPGNDTLSGQSGNDSLFYGGGQADIDGGSGRDHVHFNNAPNQAVWAHLDYQGNNQAFTRDGSQSDLDSGDWHAIAELENVEDITGTRYDDDLRGDGDANGLYGGKGDDIIEGDGGNDRLVAGDGQDTVDGGAGTDELTFAYQDEAVWAHLDYAGSNHAFTRDGSKTDLDSGDWHATAKVENVENLQGSAYDDDLQGDAGDNVVEGLRGDDVIGWSGGRDTIRGDAGEDTVEFNGGEAVWAHLDYQKGDEAWTRDGSKSGLDQGNWEGVASLSGVENLKGSAYDDDLRGDSGANVLTGRGGDDVVEGAGGQDTLVYTHDSGHDELKGGAGQDTASFADAGEAVWVHLDYQKGDEAWTRDGSKSGLDQGNWEGVAAISGVEDVEGSPYADNLRGDDGANTLHGGEGDDQLAGANGADTFVFEPGTGKDTVTDWQDGTDELDLSGFGFSGFAAVDSKASESNGNLQIDLGGGDEVEILGLSKSDFDAGDVVV